VNRGSPGGLGKQGGAAGRGGNGGPGGSAGSVMLRTLVPLRPDFIIIGSTGGLGGRAGVNGQPGPGGDPGLPGMNKTTVMAGIGEGRNFFCKDAGRDPSNTLGSGPQGPLRSPTETRPGEPIDGPKGNCQYETTPDEYDYSSCVVSASAPELAAQAALEQLQMLKLAAIYCYLSGRYSDAAEMLSWLENMTNRGTPEGSGDESTGIHAWSTTMLGQLAAGLDYYGLAPNFVPLPSYTEFDIPIDALQKLAAGLEIQRQALIDELNQEQKDEKPIKDAISSANDAISTQQAEQQDVNAQAIKLAQDIEALTRTIQVQALELSKIDELQDAITKATSQCSVTAALSFVTAMFTLATATSQVFAAIKDMSTAYDSLRTTADLKATVKNIQTVTSDITALRQKYQDLEEELAQYSNSSKLAITRSDLNDLVKKFDIEAVRAYRDLMNTYVDTCNVRSQKALDYTSLQLKLFGVQASIQQKQSSVENLQKSLVGLEDPTLLPNRIRVESILADTKQELAKRIYEQHKALEFWACQLQPFALAGDSVAEIYKAYSDNQRFELTVKERLNSMHPMDPVVSLEITEAQFPEGFKSFRTPDGAITFSISLDNPSFQARNNYATIALRGIRIRLPGARSDNGFVGLKLTHHGHAIFIDPDGRELEFSHPPVAISMTAALQQAPGTPVPANLLIDNQAALSPFAVWTLGVDDHEPGLDLSDVHTIVLTFDALGRTFN
jgi:hypothetical protein